MVIGCCIFFNTEKRERERERVNVGGWESVRPNTQFTGLQ